MRVLAPGSRPANECREADRTGEQVILVDRYDVALGISAKHEAHVAGLLHRAFSIFVFDTRGRMLLQRRAIGKYHSAGLWSNTCCSHPRPGEGTAIAAHRRLFEEMRVRCDLAAAFAFIYHADVGGGLAEHEYDHVFVGRFDGEPEPDAAEVLDWRWVAPEALARELAAAPERFTVWFRIAFEEVRARAGV